MAEGYDGAAALARRARRLQTADPPHDPRLPALFALTDPKRTPDLLTAVLGLPWGTGLILRHFGRPGLIAAAAPLARIVQGRGGVFLIAADPRLAAATGADGVHWPERTLGRARRWRMRRPAWIMTASAHSRPALLRAASLVDAVFVSPLFASGSASAVRPLGVLRAGLMVRASPIPAFALGGVNADNAAKLNGLGFSGVGAVDALMSADMGRDD